MTLYFAVDITLNEQNVVNLSSIFFIQVQIWVLSDER